MSSRKREKSFCITDQKVLLKFAPYQGCCFQHGNLNRLKNENSGEAAEFRLISDLLIYYSRIWFSNGGDIDFSADRFAGIST